MKTRTLLAALVVGALCAFPSPVTRAQDIDSMPPVVVKTVPESGSKNVAPGVVEIKVTFSKEMKDQTWSWSTAWKDSTPVGLEKPRYDSDKRTCVLKVKLEPNKTYAYWLNSQNFNNFKDQQGHAAVPYLLVFQTPNPSGGLQIHKAVCGAGDAWRDVTAFLQSNVKNDTLSVDISQPFSEIGGDPAFGQVKNLIIDYSFNYKSHRMSLEEQYPIAFTIKLPSPSK